MIIINDGVEYNIELDENDLEEDNNKLAWAIVASKPLNAKQYINAFVKSKIEINTNRFKCSY